MAPQKSPTETSSIKLRSVIIAVHLNTVKIYYVPSMYGIYSRSMCSDLENLQASQYFCTQDNLPNVIEEKYHHQILHWATNYTQPPKPNIKHN